jgi:hypothetical protein
MRDVVLHGSNSGGDLGWRSGDIGAVGGRVGRIIRGSGKWNFDAGETCSGFHVFSVQQHFIRVELWIIAILPKPRPLGYPSRPGRNHVPQPNSFITQIVVQQASHFQLQVAIDTTARSFSGGILRLRPETIHLSVRQELSRLLVCLTHLDTPFLERLRFVFALEQQLALV